MHDPEVHASALLDTNSNATHGMSQTTTITEKDTTGKVVRSYVVSVQDDPTKKSNRWTRLDTIPQHSSGASTSSSSQSSRSTSILDLPWKMTMEYLLPLFLPHGYPHTVTADYTPYQIYDSLQSFASTIAGLLSSRAVLQSMGFDDKESSTQSMATYATLLSIAQATFSNLSAILFAHYASQRISSEVKFYRFLADIVNDTAYIIDCLSPSLPRYLRLPALCCSSTLRAICGVAGGSSKAVLSSHFAINDNVGELNAKDGSQETVIGLIGMWVGGYVVNRVRSAWASRCWVLALLTLHLWFNYRAVRSVRLRGLNGYRAGRVLGELHGSGNCPSIEEIGREEGVFSRTDALLGTNNRNLGRIKIGVSIPQFLTALQGSKMSASGAWTMQHDVLRQCIDVMQDQQYLLWFDARTQMASVLLKEGATVDDQLEAWCHAIRVGSIASGTSELAWQGALDMVCETLKENQVQWPSYRSMITAAGWDLSRSGTESKPGARINIS